VLLLSFSIALLSVLRHVGAFPFSDDGEDRKVATLEDDDFAAAARPLCRDAAERVTATVVSAPATDLVALADEIEAEQVIVRKLRRELDEASDSVGEADQVLVADWLENWDTIDSVRRRYIIALRAAAGTGGGAVELAALADDADIAWADLERFAQANGLAACVLDDVALRTPPQ